MNNNIKLLLFTLLSLMPCAAEAMGIFRNARIVSKRVFQQALPKHALQSHAPVRRSANQLTSYIEKNNYYVRKARECPTLGEYIISGKWKVPSPASVSLLSLFETIKLKMKNVSHVPLAVEAGHEQVATMYDCVKSKQKIIVVDENLCKRSLAFQQFTLAHELAHASLDHGTKIVAFHDKTPEENRKMRHEIEYEADAYAASVVGDINGAREILNGKDQDTEKPEVVALHMLSHDSHPSHQARIAHLQAREKLGQLYYK